MSPTSKISYPSLSVGIPKTVLCFEMALVSILHLYAYPYDVFQKYKALSDEETVVSDTEWQDAGNDHMGIPLQQGQVAAPVKMHWSRAILHILSFQDLWQALLQSFRGVKEHRRRRAAVQRTGSRCGEGEAGFKTTSLAEALAVMQRDRC